MKEKKVLDLDEKLVEYLKDVDEEINIINSNIARERKQIGWLSTLKHQLLQQFAGSKKLEGDWTLNKNYELVQEIEIENNSTEQKSDE